MIKNYAIAFCIIILAVLGCTQLAKKYSWDITQNNANTLTKSSQQLIDSLDEMVTITVYSPEMEMLNTCDAVLTMFKKYSPKIQASLQQTILEPRQAAQYKVTTENVLMLKYKDVQQAVDIRLNEVSEQQISSLLQQVINYANNWLVFLSGHQEADPLDKGEFGLSGFANIFAQQGMHIATLNLAQTQAIPHNTALLVVANPQQDFLPIEKSLLHQYLCNGGKLLWFTEPDSPITAMLAEEFGLKPSKGVAIDPESLRLGSPHPALKILTQYPEHAINKDLTTATIFPWSAHLKVLYQANDWEQTAFLTTSAQTWTYNGPAAKDLELLSKYKENIGPLNLGFALSRQKQDQQQEQRALVIGDSSFMINKYLNFYANAQLATNIVKWTQQDAQVLIFNTPPLKDLSYYPSKLDQFMYKYVFTLVMPLILIGVGFCLGRGWPKLQFRFRIR